MFGSKIEKAVDYCPFHGAVSIMLNNDMTRVIEHTEDGFMCYTVMGTGADTNWDNTDESNLVGEPILIPENDLYLATLGVFDLEQAALSNEGLAIKEWKVAYSDEKGALYSGCWLAESLLAAMKDAEADLKGRGTVLISETLNANKEV